MFFPSTSPVARLALPVLLLLAAARAQAALPPPDGLDVMINTDPAVAVEHLTQFQEVDRLFNAGDQADAIPQLEQLVARYPADGHLWDGLGYACYGAGDYGRAAEAYRRAVDIGTTFSVVSLYNLACCHALTGELDAAVAALREALAAGFENRPGIRRDSDLDALHDHPAWTELAGLLPAEVEAAGRDAGWRYDLAFWLREVERMHPDPFGQVGEAEFKARVARLDARIPDLGDEQILTELQKLTVLLGDGHSGIRPQLGSRVHLNRLPLQLYAFADGLFIVNAPRDRADLIGSELLRIGERSVDELWPGLADLVPRDNAMGLLDVGPLMLTYTATLRDLGAIGDTEDVPLRLRDRDGGERTVTLTATMVTRGASRELEPQTGPEAPEPPLFLAHDDAVFWMCDLPGVDHGLYAQFNVVRNAPDSTIADYAAALRGRLQADPALDVIALDLRHNGGGNSFLYPPLVRALVAYGQERPDARLYVLTGRRTFSACQNLATDLDWWTDAIFAGEPTGSRPNAIGESTWSELPYSRLRAGISSRYHQESYPGDDRPWIAPQLPVAFTSAAYFAGQDPVLEAVVAVERAR